ncbi:MAG: response regulator transcription factor [Pyrinomonadaceae bacterium]|nr:response regulator transcription factor [Pyrinomonadaceae bacterium]
MENKITVVAADDHPLFLDGLKQAIREDKGIEMLAESRDGETALENIRRRRPDVAVVDISMPKLDGLELLQTVVQEKIPVSIIFLTMYREKRLFDRALELGVLGYLLKDSVATDIVRAIYTVSKGNHFISPAMTQYLVDTGKRPGTANGSSNGVAALSPAERKVLALIAEYKTSRQIAEELFISPRTVETHRTHICQKLGLQGNHALIRFAVSHKETVPRIPF